MPYEVGRERRKGLFCVGRVRTALPPFTIVGHDCGRRHPMEQPADVLATVSGGDIAIRVCREEWTDDGASGVTGSSAVLVAAAVRRSPCRIAIKFEVRRGMQRVEHGCEAQSPQSWKCFCCCCWKLAAGCYANSPEACTRPTQRSDLSKGTAAAAPALLFKAERARWGAARV